MFRKFIILFSLFLSGALAAFAGPVSISWSMGDIKVSGHGDTLSVGITWSFSGGAVPDNEALVVCPSFRSYKGQIQLPPVTLYGSKSYYNDVVASGRADEHRVLKGKKEISFRCDDEVSYESWMDTVRISVSVYRWTKRNGMMVMSMSQKYQLAKPRRPEEPVFPWEPLVPDKDASKTRTLSFSYPVSFASNQSKFDFSYGNNSIDLLPFIKKVKAISSGKRFTVRSSKFSVSLPPGVDVKDPAKLSRQRAQSLYTYLQRSGAFTLSTPTVTGGGVDWDGFEEMVLMSPYSDDARIIEILSSDMDQKSKADALRREKPGAWEYFGENFFPALGKATYNVSFVPLKFSNPKYVLPVYEEVPEVLSPYDFYYLAYDYPVMSGERLSVLETGAILYPDDEKLNMDVAMLYVQNGFGRGAVPYLRNIGDSDEAKYVYAVWLFYEGRYRECLDIFSDLKDRNVKYAALWPTLEMFALWSSNHVMWDIISK